MSRMLSRRHAVNPVAGDEVPDALGHGRAAAAKNSTSEPVERAA